MKMGEFLSVSVQKLAEIQQLTSEDYIQNRESKITLSNKFQVNELRCEIFLKQFFKENYCRKFKKMSPPNNESTYIIFGSPSEQCSNLSSGIGSLRHSIILQYYTVLHLSVRKSRNYLKRIVTLNDLLIKFKSSMSD